MSLKPALRCLPFLFCTAIAPQRAAAQFEVTDPLHMAVNSLNWVRNYSEWLTQIQTQYTQIQNQYSQIASLAENLKRMGSP
ncbi:MAG: hypothetical protein EOP86_28175, partial [Verrucomicrobiaceae bacterium]